MSTYACQGCKRSPGVLIQLEPTESGGLFCDNCRDTYDAPEFLYCDVSCAHAYCKPHIIDFDAKCIPGASIVLEDTCTSCQHHITVEIEYSIQDVYNNTQQQ